MSDSLNDLDEIDCYIRKDPLRALDLCQNYLAQHPDDRSGLFRRFEIWDELGEFQKALADISRVIELKPDFGSYSCRGMIRRKLGDHVGAIKDFTHSRKCDERTWRDSFDPHFRADSLARLGRTGEALADCIHIPEDHAMPAVLGLPGGDKADFIAEIKRRAAAARQRNS